jgi:hypothetical protein
MGWVERGVCGRGRGMDRGKGRYGEWMGIGREGEYDNTAWSGVSSASDIFEGYGVLMEL